MPEASLENKINNFRDNFLSPLTPVTIMMYSYWVGEGGGIPHCRAMNFLLFDQRGKAELFVEDFNKNVIKDLVNERYLIARIFDDKDDKFYFCDRGHNIDGKFSIVDLITFWHDIPNYANLKGSIHRGSLAFDNEATAKRFVTEFNNQKFNNERCENKAILEEK